METATARETLRERAYDLSPDQFEVLCKVVLADNLRTQSLTVTPASQDGGIDIEGRLHYDWFAADYGVQAKRYATDNRVGNDRVHRLAGALVDGGYDLGTLVTTSSFTQPAEDAAERLPVKLVSGTDLANAMLRSELGVRRRDDEYELTDQFWETLSETDEKIPAGEVPLGSNFDRLRAVLLGMRHTRGTKDAIGTWIRDELDVDLSERHVYINANSATVLGLARKEPGADHGTLQQWGLTKPGAAYLAADAGSATARERLADAIRDVDLIESILENLRDAGEMTTGEIDDHIAAETTGLSDASVSRRGSAVRTWLAQLPEVEVDTSTSPKRYGYAPDDTSDTSLDWS